MKEYSETLYKKDTKGKIRKLYVYTLDGTLFQISGLLSGKLVEHSSKSTPKNVGKVNETTAQEQAVLEAKSIIAKKLDEGYFKTQQEAEDEVVILPMLAKDYKKEVKKVVYPCYVQPKLDGMRCLGSEDKMLSRKGKVLDTVDHIRNDIGKQDYILDGELYAHGRTFQENMSLIKKYREGETEEVKYHVYDLVSDIPFTQRLKLLAHIAFNKDHIALVTTHIVKDEEEMLAFHKKFLSEGYEGTMVRWGNEGYKVNGRSSNLLKYKDFHDIVCEVVDVVSAEKDPTQGVVHCKMTNGATFGCGMKFSHTERQEVLTNKSKYIGKMAEIRFFEYTDDGLPRFPVCYGFRLDK